MSPVTVKEAEPQMGDLIPQAAEAHEVTIRGSVGTAGRLVSVEVRVRPRFGSARHLHQCRRF